ncbi:hypothetical protein IEQ34_025500 [Dendrobium chrysotoxum]|uniref:Uncharacterized protein n=1 Tax=Dendrobium chrysotoxum TaxID=161865 RepID=A0AAV7FQ41_DENCH|nr:hypothetical protein IEQ34_025500 [Dendrobium chrysotoxum]
MWTDGQTSAFFCALRHRADPNLLIWSCPCRNWAGRKRVGFANAVRAVRKIGPLRKAELFGSRPSTCLPPFSCLIS